MAPFAPGSYALHEQQEQPYWCWAAVLCTARAHLLGALPSDYPQCEVANVANALGLFAMGVDCCTDKAACNATRNDSQIAAIINNMKSVATGDSLFKAYLKATSLPKSKIKKYFANGRVILAALRHTSGGSGHLVLVTRYIKVPKRMWLLLHDPATNHARWVSRKYLKKKHPEGKWDTTIGIRKV